MPTTVAPASGLMSVLRALVASLVLLAPAAGAIAQAPQPAPVPSRWQLDFKPGLLRTITVDTPGVGPRVYLYFTYTVENNSGQDLLFAPQFELATDDGDLLRSGRDVPMEITRRVIEELQNPFVQDQVQIIGQILQGRENAKDGVVIWPAPTLRSSEIIIFTGGMSGETAMVSDPMTGERRVTRKTWMGTYAVPGTLVGQGSRPLERTDARWVMR